MKAGYEIETTLKEIKSGSYLSISVHPGSSGGGYGIAARLNQIIESASATQAFQVSFELCEESHPTAEKCIAAIVGKKAVELVLASNKEEIAISFSRRAWFDLGGFREGAELISILKEFGLRSNEVRRFTSIELDLPPRANEARPTAADSPVQRRVLFFVPYGDWLMHNQVEAIIASALKLRGAEIMIVGCDGLFTDGCYVLAHSKNPQVDCRLCIQKGQQFFAAFGHKLSQIRDYLDPQEYARIVEWTNSIPEESYIDAMFGQLPVGKWVTPHVCSYFRVTPDLFNQPKIREHQRKYLAYSLATYTAAAKIFDSFKPSNIVTFAGAGFMHAPVFHLSRERNLTVLTHDKGIKDKSFTIHLNEQTCSVTPQFEITDAWKDVPLNREELEGIKSYFSNREEGRDISNSKGFYDFSTEYGSVRAKLGIPSDAKIFGFFTSSEYELAYTGQYDGR